MANLSEFYTGPMLAPDRTGPNTFQQAQIYGSPSTLAQVYAGILPARVDPVGEGLSATGGWNQFDDQFGTTVQHPATVMPHASGTLVASKDQGRLPAGPALAFGDTAPQPAPLAAISSVAPETSQLSTMFGGAPNPASSGAISTADPWSGSRIGPAGGGTPGLVTGKAPPPPPTPVQSLAAMFTPAPQPKAPLGYDPRVDVTGMAQQQGPGQNAGGWGINAGGGIVPF